MCTSPDCKPGYFTYNTAMSTETGQGGVNDDSIQGLLNDTDSELSSLSHLDAPNDSLYMIGGVCVAMFMVGVIIILLAVTINKLRKREEHSNTVHPINDAVVLQTTPTTPNNNNTGVVTTTLAVVTTIGTNGQQPGNQQLNGGSTIAAQQQTQPQQQPQYIWQFPPAPAQYLYSNEQNNLVQPLPAERAGFVRGFRKNLGGKWRRLVKRKPQQEVYAIPPELKYQLKEIYVY